MLSKSKRVWLTCILVSGFANMALAQLDQELQQKVAAAKADAARNQQALRSYSWISTTDLMHKGELKNSKIESCEYGPDGKVQKVQLSEPPPEHKRRGLRGRIIRKKTAEMKQELESAAALAHNYVPPSSERMQLVIAAGRVSLAQAGPGAIALTFPGYEKEGDSLTLTFDSEVHTLRQMQVNTWLDDPSNAVALNVTLESLPDGTNYPASTVLTIPAKQIEVRIENTNYQRVVQ